MDSKLVPDCQSGGGKGREKNQNIQVFVRVRPMNTQEIQKHAAEIIDTPGTREVVVRERTVANVTKTFTFDRVFGPRSKQIDVYKTVVAPLLQEVLLGYNCTVFAYGQTGTGKTFTMEGERSKKSGTGDCNTMGIENDPLSGILPRALGQLFDEVRLMDCEFSVRVSFLELYNEELTDLLASAEDKKTLRLYEDSHRKGSVIIQGLEEVIVNNKHEVYTVLERGSQHRKTAATNLNASSSRSHTVFTITVHMKESSVEGEEMVKVGKLHLVDLAGSENIGKSGAMDKRAREAGSINQSLLTLGRVISALVERAPHIPYRESKLTRLLQDSLGGKTKTSIIATISPAVINIEETLSTLDYAHRAKNILNRPEVNQRLTKKEALNIYTEEIERLRRDLNATRDKTGVHMDTENYNRTMSQIESQRHELNEKSSKIRELEESVTNREEEIRVVMEMVDDLKSNVDEKQAVIADLRARLARTEETLTNTKERKDELDYLVSAHVQTEEKLTGEANVLMDTAKDTVSIIDKLHGRLERKQQISEMNWKNAERFRDDFGRYTLEMCKFVNQMREVHTLKISEMRRYLRDHTGERQVTARNFTSAFDEAMKKVSSLGITLTEMCTMQAAIAESKLDGNSKMAATHHDLIRQTVKKNFGSVIESLNEAVGFLEKGKKQVTKLNDAIPTRFQKMADEILNVLALNMEGFNLIGSYSTKLHDDWNPLLDQMINRLKTFQTSQSGFEENAMKNINLIRAAMQRLEQDTKNHVQATDRLHAEFTGTLTTLGERIDKDREDVVKLQDDRVVAANACVSKFQQYKQDNVEGHQASLRSLTDNLAHLSSACSVLAFNVKGYDADNSTSLSKLRSKMKETTTEFANDLKTWREDLKNKLDDQMSKVDGVSLEAKSYVEGSLQNGEEFGKHVENHLDAQCDAVSASTIEMGERLMHAAGNVDEFWDETYITEIPSGATPMRRRYEFPQELTATSPHARIIHRFRRRREELQAALDEAAEAPDDDPNANVLVE